MRLKFTSFPDRVLQLSLHEINLIFDILLTGYDNGSWERFAETVGLDSTTILYLRSLKGFAPMDEVLKTYSSRAGSTVGHLYDVFVKCELEILADEL